MRKLWWPEPLYEMKPYGALTLGLLAALISAARGWATQAWDRGFAGAIVLAAAAIAYALVIIRMRHNYRSRSRWNQESHT